MTKAKNNTFAIVARCFTEYEVNGANNAYIIIDHTLSPLVAGAICDAMIAAHKDGQLPLPIMLNDAGEPDIFVIKLANEFRKEG